MAELRDAGTDVAYRPLSGLALSGFAISCLFGGVVAVSAIMGIVQGAAFFFPSWTLLIALAGFLVSWSGLSDIRNSEGTKAGQKLATYGLWISLISGAGYFAYSYVTGLALKKQTFEFFMNYEDGSGFFPRLQKAAKDKVELNRAFLLTLPAPQRAGIRPDDEAAMARRFDQPSGPDNSPGDLTRFRANQLILGILTGASAVTIEPIGIERWKYEKHSYHVTCQFRVHSPEALIMLALTARSAEGEEEGQSRQWFVDITSMNYFAPLQRTPLGDGLLKLRIQAAAFVESIETGLRTGAVALEFAKIDKTDWSKFDPAARNDIKSRVQGIFDGLDISPNWHFKATRDPTITEWQRDSEGRTTLVMPFSLMFVGGQSAQPIPVEGFATVRSKGRIDPVQYSQGEIETAPQWELQHIEFLRYRPSMRK